MSVTTPAFRIPRRSVEQPAGEAGHWVKIFDPPKASVDTPERLIPTNPVPEVMLAAGFQDHVSRPHTVQRDLMHGMRRDTWDNRPDGLFWFDFRDRDNVLAKDGTYPGATIRVPRGVIFHSQTKGHGPPPHTIHWHGIEPTSMNDGVGHCSMEIGDYIYQWQPNGIGTYFYHCHRNTVQHFEFGLFGLLLVETPDTFLASLNPDGTLNPDIPLGAGRDGLRRTAAAIPVNLQAQFQFPGLNPNPLDTPDPLGQFPTDPHAFTIPYDVEAFWVLDDRDSAWSDFAPDARAFMATVRNDPGVDDRIARGFFHDYNSDYWFVTGVPVPARLGGTATIAPADSLPGGGGLPGGMIPPELNSGVSGTQVAINAHVDQTILVRVLDAAYNDVRVTFPVNVVIIAFDGRALGVPPFGTYNRAFLLPAGTPMTLSTARRFDALIRTAAPVSGFVTVEFLDTRRREAAPPVPAVRAAPRMTTRIPLVITSP